MPAAAKSEISGTFPSNGKRNAHILKFEICVDERADEISPMSVSSADVRQTNSVL